MSGGQPTKYDPKYCEMIIDYFDVKHYKKEGRNIQGADLPQFTAFARSIGVTRATLFNWTKEHQEFFDAYSTARQLQEELIVNNSINNRYNSYFAQFMLKNCHNWKDKSEVENNHAIAIEISKDDEQL